MKAKVSGKNWLPQEEELLRGDNLTMTKQLTR